MSKSTFGFDRAEQSLGFLLWQTTALWQRLIKKILEPHKLTHPQFVVLAILLWFREHGQEVNQMTIAQWSKLDRMAVSKALKKLEIDSYVARSEHSTDPRAKSVQLTENGLIKITKLVPRIEAVDSLFFSKLSIAKQNRLIDMFITLTGFSDENI